jgi:hypothetical protein
MSRSNGEVVSVKIIPNETGNLAGKLADAEVIFESEADPLSGLKLIDFAIWERRNGGRNVTLHTRQYSVNGERRSFALLRPATGELSAQEPIRSAIIEVTATYLLSEEGRKALLLAGGNGRAVQEITIHVPANRLHLVTADTNGRAHLKLRPRFQLNAEQRVVKIDSLPTYDVPPTVDELFRDAGRNHQLEHAFLAERSAERRVQRDAEQQRRDEIASAFLADPTQRAMRRPSPTPQRCFLDTPEGRVLFDVRQHHGSARSVPPEAYRRWRTDLRAREEWRQKETAAQLASHAHKKQVIADWVTQYGTPPQRARQAAGVLPMEEVIEAMTDQAFEAGNGFERYAFDGAARLQQRLRELPQYANVVITPNNITIFNTDAVKATDAQWTLVQELQRVFSDATLTLRQHRISWKGDVGAPTLTMYGVIVMRKVGPFDLRWEYAAPDA